MEEDFQEIAHCGGRQIIEVKTTPEGVRQVGGGFQHSRPTPMKAFAIYALHQGIPVATVQLGGIGDPWNAPPYERCTSVFIASDNTGLFGHQCTPCNAYWRSDGASSRWRMTCPYCGGQGMAHLFLTEGQRAYVSEYCRLYEQAIYADQDGTYVVDMDTAVDAALKGLKRPKFYYSETSQQNRYQCKACNSYQDILGVYGYCSNCMTANGVQMLQDKIDVVRERLKTTGAAANGLRDAVSDYDACGRWYAKKLTTDIPLTKRRKGEMNGLAFHNLKKSATAMKDAFDIDVLRGMKQAETEFVNRMFCRRHVHEHNAGVVDQKYLEDSGDTTVPPGQALREQPGEVMRATEAIMQMARNLHAGFHELFPPETMPIECYQSFVKRQKTSD